MTTLEISQCIVHRIGDCPDDLDCKYERQIVRTPRYTGLVANAVDGCFTVETWAAPKAPPDGTKAVGETVLADVDFDIVAVRFA